MNLSDLTLRSFHDGLRGKKFSALEAVQEHFKAIRAKDPGIHAYLTLLEEDATGIAGQVDESLAKGDQLAPLAGAPLAIKDNFLIKGHQATAGSKILEGYTASYDAHVIEKLKSERAVFLGKTNLDEFAMGTSTENSAFGPTKNPHDLERVPGGSSGGSAAAVAGNLALAALGTDTGGSGRQPAALCGVVGFKPTYGAVSRSGIIALGSSLDQVGILAKTTEDVAMLFRAIAGHDPMDATSVAVRYDKDLIEPDIKSMRGLTIGVPKEYFIDGIAPDVREGMDTAMRQLKDLGFKFKEISLPHTKYAISVYYVILPAEASATLARFDGIRYAGRPELPNNFTAPRGAGFGPEPTRRIILGTFVLSAGYYDAYYKKAQEVRTLVKDDFVQAFKEVDVIFAPTAPSSAFKIGEKSDDPLKLYLEDAFTIPVNLAGIPAVSIPVRGRTGLPVGFQLIGRHFREADILGIGRIYEEAQK